MISCDDGSFIAVWDIENGKLMSKFGKAHKSCKITSACFDGSQRRIVTAAEDGSIRVWNFSNGECLTKFVYDEPPPKRHKKKTDVVEEEEKKQKQNPMQKFKEMLAAAAATAAGPEQKPKKRKRPEVTALCFVFDPAKKDDNKKNHIVSVGWDRRIHVWPDQKDKPPKVLPQKG